MKFKDGYGKAEGKDAYHILKVLRHKTGDIIDIVDEKGFKGKAIITSVKEYSSFTFRILYLEHHNPEFLFQVVLAQSIIKGKNFSFLLKKATELGISRIIPIFSEKSVVKKVNMERWNEIVKEASKQSMRIFVPKIEEPLNFTDIVEMAKEKYDLKIILSPSSNTHIRSFLDPLSMPESLIFLTGPEGGFSHKEVDYAKTYGFIDINLGPRILRAETVPLVFLSILEYKWGRYEKDSI